MKVFVALTALAHAAACASISQQQQQEQQEPQEPQARPGLFKRLYGTIFQSMGSGVIAYSIVDYGKKFVDTHASPKVVVTTSTTTLAPLAASYFLSAASSKNHEFEALTLQVPKSLVGDYPLTVAAACPLSGGRPGHTVLSLRGVLITLNGTGAQPTEGCGYEDWDSDSNSSTDTRTASNVEYGSHLAHVMAAAATSASSASTSTTTSASTSATTHHVVHPMMKKAQAPEADTASSTITSAPSSIDSFVPLSTFNSYPETFLKLFSQMI